MDRALSDKTHSGCARQTVCLLNFINKFDRIDKDTLIFLLVH